VSDPTDAGGRLLIVDDEPVICELLASIFEGEPYVVTTCATGREAIDLIDAHGVDVLLTDKNLPDVNGIDLVRHVKDVQPDAECLIITGYPSLDTALKAMELDVFDYIVKPPRDVFDVRRKVRQAFAKQAVVRENRRLLADLVVKNAELVKAVQELRSMQDELIQSEKLAGIGTLAAGIAHEISSPLFGIMGLAEAIRDEDDLRLVHDYAQEIVDYSRTIKDIVTELTGYSRASPEDYHTTVDLAQVAEDAVRLIARSSEYDTSVVRVEAEPGLYVIARSQELQQVFVNLVRNAIEAVVEAPRAGSGEVRVKLGRGDGHVWARVEDDGPGIPEDKRNVVFDPFYTTKPPGKGTGLGLNIVYRIVTKYRGQIAVEGRVPRGSVFHLRFPAGDGP
jgi:signal transduction histidine kinase